MRVPVTESLRWSRALLLAAVAVLVGAVAHVGADGLMPGPVGVGLVLAVTTVACAALLGRPASTLRVVALLVGGQGFVHVALSLLAGHHGDPVGAVATPRAAFGGEPRIGSFREQMQAVHVGTISDRPTVPDPVLHLVEHVAEQGALMVLAHLGAAAALGLWLAVGERALFCLLALLGAPSYAVRALLLGTGTLATVRGAAALLRRSRRIRDLRRIGVPTAHLATRAVVRRGPPALLAV